MGEFGRLSAVQKSALEAIFSDGCSREAASWLRNYGIRFVTLRSLYNRGLVSGFGLIGMPDGSHYDVVEYYFGPVDAIELELRYYLMAGVCVTRDMFAYYPVPLQSLECAP